MILQVLINIFIFSYLSYLLYYYKLLLYVKLLIYLYAFSSTQVYLTTITILLAADTSEYSLITVIQLGTVSDKSDHSTARYCLTLDNA